MIYRDVLGQSINVGDTVLFSLGLGVTANAVVQKTDAILSPNSQPTIQIAVTIPLPAAPNGVVGGITKINSAPASKITEA